MPLMTGARLGPYEIVAPLGQGGMGEVYKARDTRLDRLVAIKILPDALAADPMFRERFEREARTISQLDHPHICALYDTGREGDTSYIVMQYLDGETLADRLARAPLPLDDLLRYAAEIADALDRAHRSGVVHRDLKPGNVMLTKTGAKLLDFGLAKIGAPVQSGSSLSILPTTPAGLTAQGTILGTFHYMAPEQLEGAEADARTDIFAFGAMLYEMATRRKAFEGRSQATLIAAIIGSEPPAASSVNTAAPPALDRVIRKCLAKDPDNRWQSAHDLRDELVWIQASGSQIRTDAATATALRAPRRKGVPIAVTAIVASALVAVAAIVSSRIPGRSPREVDQGPPVRSLIPIGSDLVFGSSTPSQSFAISPDGRRLAYSASVGTHARELWIRPLDGTTAQPLPGTDGASSPFWSPDSRFVGFLALGKLKKVEVNTSVVTTIADASGIQRGSWNRDDTIVYTPRVGPLFRISASGGTPTRVTELDTAAGEVAHSSPSFLPDGRHFFYVATTNAEVPASLFIGSLDAQFKRTRVAGIASNAEYALGHILFTRDRVLLAQRFDPSRFKAEGEPFTLGEQLEVETRPFNAAFQVSGNLLVYRTGSDALRSQLAWIDRSGKQIGEVGDPIDQMAVALSPDSTRAVVSILDPARNTRDLWIYDLTRGLRTRFTFDPADEILSVWSADGQDIVFSSRRKGRLDLYRKSSNGAGAETPLYSDNQNNLYPVSWHPREQALLFYTGNASSRTGNDIFLLPLAGDAKPVPIVQTDFNEMNPAISPDGRWIAFSSNESGQTEVYVVPFRGSAGKWQVSAQGGSYPRWRRDGKELFYLSGERKLMAAEIDGSGPALRLGRVQALFDTRVRQAGFSGSNSYNYDVSPDGRRFLINTLTEAVASNPFTVVMNWTALKK
jgi:eukaryotic-like serine/threonine-protein kinase